MAQRKRQPHSAPAVSPVLSPVRSRHILNSIPTVIYVLAITAKGFRSQWVSDSVKRILGYEIECDADRLACYEDKVCGD